MFITGHYEETKVVEYGYRFAQRFYPIKPERCSYRPPRYLPSDVFLICIIGEAPKIRAAYAMYIRESSLRS